ncbi:MAG: hypothetical protein LBF54_00090 [Holosporaceae bacterium]|nr:hypothetical protein [Holosporaceae bacterium]
MSKIIYLKDIFLIKDSQEKEKKSTKKTTTSRSKLKSTKYNKSAKSFLIEKKEGS